jgi:hypothetical protein
LHVPNLENTRNRAIAGSSKNKITDNSILI